MLTFIASAALLIAQAGSIAEMGEPSGAEAHDVAYSQIEQGELASAVRSLESLRRDNPDDPALLINLGSAYAATGDLDRAEAAYRAASLSAVRYRLELADGSWVDSRQAARIALRELENQRLALK